ncbi:conserved hypothetical protein [Desulfamplus magnetovallimortis]|uniref:Putative restriction endonuclease domain-containing protein n=1 Tax=Desulfamplus magnetovallimortis TaxID=1246637 RepID=A0A1W1H970_9BACT|nr:Uma2 family endonuclease [Desulfamplus magnetovallimortis]SLM28955.1 conserved hypothetical protein [Desulfamplus magnetovallimortis]
MNAHPQMQSKMTPEEYLLFEKESETKHEFYNGEIFAMTGAKPDHNRIQSNFIWILKRQLVNSYCDVFPSDQRVKVNDQKYYYPDISVSCDDVKFDDSSLLNPIVIIEILSDSTELFDRNGKFRDYRSILSFKEYVLVSQYECFVERFRRNNDNTWNYREYNNFGQILKLESIKCELPLSEIYHRVNLLI